MLFTNVIAESFGNAFLRNVAAAVCFGFFILMLFSFLYPILFIAQQATGSLPGV
ncbi:hypothetical protein LJR231_005927 [Phyllobacterium sp. LjRoot231]|uniref:hypothetical protein n=1 Tax=Phyllobacterium sp. LjRoot231 TaxID=3342289 RepID=UPI003ED119E6